MKGLSLDSNWPALIALDLDGTVVNEDGVASFRNIQAIEKMQELGSKIVFVTGRPPRWMSQISDQFNNGHAIIANGALLYDLATNQTYPLEVITEETQQTIISKIRNAGNKVAFALEGINFYSREKDYIPRWDDGNDPIGVFKIEESIKAPAYKILAQSKVADISADDFLSEIRHTLGRTASATYCNTGVSLVEISAIKANKAHGLSEYAKKYNISNSNVYAFGDNVNDFEMLAWSKHSWIMESGHPDGVKFAKYVAPGFEHDGLAQILETLFMKFSRN